MSDYTKVDPFDDDMMSTLVTITGKHKHQYYFYLIEQAYQVWWLGICSPNLIQLYLVLRGEVHILSELNGANMVM